MEKRAWYVKNVLKNAPFEPVENLVVQSRLDAFEAPKTVESISEADAQEIPSLVHNLRKGTPNTDRVYDFGL